MLSENETLFVEHKAGLAYAAVKAICSFANTLGGWVLIGVDDDGQPNEGTADGWVPVPAAQLADRVRDALHSNKVDPIPAFAATVPSFCASGERVGVVRVYESNDTPHVVGNGQVFVRSVAQDQNVTRVFRAGGVETQAVLIGMVDRGQKGLTGARSRLDSWEAPFAVRQLGFTSSYAQGQYVAPAGAVLLRAAPVTHGRLEDWAISESAAEVLIAATERLVPPRGGRQVTSTLGLSGIAAQSGGQVELIGFDTPAVRHPVGTTAADCAGVVGSSVSWGNSNPPPEPARMTLDGFRDQMVTPVLAAVCDVLSGAELYGRSVLELAIENLEQHVLLDDGELRTIPSLTLNANLSLPLGVDQAGLRQLADRWRDDVARAAGCRRFRS